MLSVIVDGLWREGDKSLAVRLVAEDGNALRRGSPARTLMCTCPAARCAVFPDRCVWRRELSYLRGAANRLARRIALRS